MISTAPQTFAAQALERLRTLTADDAADFRPGQLEAIHDVVVDRARVLCVQRTGWGKSAVYFVATALLRESDPADPAPGHPDRSDERALPGPPAGPRRITVAVRHMCPDLVI